MPRRGDHQHDFPGVAEPEAPVDRIGIRLVRAPDRTGIPREITLDPAGFRCAALAGELADEWVDYAEISRISGGSAALGRRAIRNFCTKVDFLLAEDAREAGLAKQHPDIAAVLAEWERTLPADYRAGSTTPSTLAAMVRALIARRAQHDQRPVAPHLRRLVDGEVGVAAGSTQEVDEFSRKDKRAVVRAAWAWANELDSRLSEGWAWAAQGRDPAEHGWTSVANLLWGLARQQVSPLDIRDNLPVIHRWPPELRACIERPDRPVFPARAKGMLVRWLVRQLYPGHLDLHAYRVLLVAATGHTSEEVTALTGEDAEFLPSGVRLTLTKQRAQKVRHRTFGTETLPETTVREPVDFTDRPHREIGAIIRRLMHVTEQLRLRAPDEGRLFLAASVTADYELRIARWDYNLPRSRFVNWLAAADVTVDGAPDIRRLRKSTKVEKAIAFGGRIADTANDHHEEVFRGHYAQGTTLRVMSGQVIATAQDHWFTKALEGPTVLTTSTEVLDAPDQAETLGLSTQQAEDIRRGALDMGLTQCADPHNSPYGRSGELCPVAPLRCLECRNAWILPSDLPQLLLFADHLDRLRMRLSPQHFGQLWGQTHTNLHAVLADRTDEEKALARKHIEAGQAALHLPLVANVEFDS
ncbi:hypothetical protein ACH47B_30070 [Rhodococcus sp. NPDC019627]|uniref:hypothetical protein n=1 Tax=unclassified Rhodococcus (in: high G+C Gram-positive bacteria) TaxID=192944 RepID=UPI00340AF3C2